MNFFKILGKILEFITDILVAFVALVILLPIVIILGFLCMKDLKGSNNILGPRDENNLD